MHWGGGHLICQLQLFAALANSCSSPLRHACFYSKRPIVLSFLLEPTVLLFCTTVYLVLPPRHLYLHRVTCTSTASPVPPPRHLYLHRVTCTSTTSPVPPPRHLYLHRVTCAYTASSGPAVPGGRARIGVFVFHPQPHADGLRTPCARRLGPPASAVARGYRGASGGRGLRVGLFCKLLELF